MLPGHSQRSGSFGHADPVAVGLGGLSAVQPGKGKVLEGGAVPDLPGRSGQGCQHAFGGQCLELGGGPAGDALGGGGVDSLRVGGGLPQGQGGPLVATGLPPAVGAADRHQSLWGYAAVHVDSL